ncbi:hypothetical protein GA0070624_3334 [Micromonospora rhizosphaerae]|uniref:Outer membrane protein assembly factor BamB, contains PQQ-like beta-propeller repeat n=1 Tax=Micromonospora rhizosphaerae TaxID=568872 RepID=A0A1C6SAY9_9ACTN|nr:PQQ-binding-like beta-propeller repeat protein [Micromonospora rhizosphaerae]SCL26576.1 hypothetical protein GA0070624_3334 [Micromonospora rhizosphaerae]
MRLSRSTRALAAITAVATALVLPTTNAAAADEPPPPPTPGATTDFGVQSTALTVFEGYFGTDAGGRPMWYSVQMGTPGVLAAVDPVSRQHVHTAELPESSGAWAVTQANDGKVYAGSYPNAHVYQHDPATGQTVDLGAPVPNQTVLYGFQAGTDGKIYGGTYPSAHAFSYSPSEGFRDLGQMFDGEQYVIDVAIDPGREVLWAAIGSHGHIIRYDLRTGEKRDILPEARRGSTAYPADMNLVGGQLVLKLSNLQAIVLDADTGEPVPLVNRDTGQPAETFSLTSRGTSRIAPDGRSVYYTAGLDLARYDLIDHTFGPVRDASGAAVKAGGAGVGWGWLDGSLYALIGNYAGQALTYDPATGAADAYTLPFPYQPIDIANINAGEDGNIYTNLYINGSLTILDPVTGKKVTQSRLGQTEGWAWHGGKMYIGVYPAGRIMEYDPTKPYSFGTNPRELFSLQSAYGQNRPVAFVDAGDAMYIASTPDYGLWGGALTRYEYATGQYTVQRNIVTDQGVTSLATIDGKLWGGTSISGGGGTDPKATEAKLFSVDPATGAKTRELVPVPGAYAITSLIAGPDGKLWGLADNTLFIADPTTGEVTYRQQLPGVYSGVQDELYLNPDEHVYASLDGNLLRIDALSYQVTVVRDSGTYRLAQDKQGNLWFRNGVKADHGAVQYGSHLLRYTPQADACPKSDLRADVFTGDVDSGVANRYRPDGCTVNDLIRDDQPWKNHGEFVSHVAHVTEQLVSNGILTAAEKDAIVDAAGRSGIGG